MAFVIADRVRETTTTTGTGAVTLAGAYISFQSFSTAIGNGNNTYYTIVSPATGEWEVGIGTYTSSTNSLSRDTILSSSNSGSAVNFAAGSKDVFVTQPASRAIFVQNGGTGLQTGNAAFTANRVLYSNATTTTATSANLTFDGTTLTAANFADSSLTSGRVTYATTSGNLTDSANLLFDGTTLTANALTTTSTVTINGGTANGVAYLNGSKVLTSGSALTFDGTTLATTTLDATNLEVTNVKALDGTAAFSIASSTGVVTIDDTKFTLQDETDNTKKAQFQLSSIATATARTYTLQNASGTIALLSGSQTFSGATTFSSTFTLSGTTTNISLGASQTTGTWTAGGTAQTGAITLGQSTGAQTLNLGTGATTTATTKTINLGTAGVSGSTTAINIGSAVSGAVNTITINGNPTYSGGTANGVLYLDGSKVATSGSALTFDGSALSASGNITSGGVLQALTTVQSSSGADLSLNANGANRDIIYKVNATELMRLVGSTGNLGIGTSSPSTKLQVNFSSATAYSSGATGNGLLIYNTSTTNGQYAGIFFQGEPTAGNAGQASIYGTTTSSGNMDLVFSTRGSSTLAERMRLDSSGNLGLGVTPSAWVSTFKAFQVGTGGTFYGDYNNTTSYFGNNAYFNGTNWKYVSSSYALYAYQDRTAGKHVWAVAASGTAGNNITWTEAMTLDASGNLGVGTTSPASFGALCTRRGIAVTNVTGSVSASFSDGANDTLYVSQDSSLSRLTFATLTFNTGTTERARIDSSGNLLVGTTSAISSGTTFKSANGVSVYRNDSTAAYQGFSFYSDNGSTQATKAYFRNDGGLANYSANDVNLSDVRLKKDIVPAGDYLAKICAIKVRNFRFKTQDASEDITLGVIAQEVESVAPELVCNDGFGEIPDDGIPLKSIYQTDLQYALMKCIQEQQAIIEQLKARLDAANL